VKREQGTGSKKGKLAIVAQLAQTGGAAGQRRVANAWRRGEARATQ
jgi:hypothetical protein